MATADVRITIARPLSEVFAYMADYDNNHVWQDGVVSSKQTTAGDPRPGVEVAYTRQVLGRNVDTTATLVVHEPDARLRVRSSSAAFTYEGGYDFEGDETTTHVHYRGEITTSRLLGFVGKALAGKFQTQMESDLANLKRLMESGQVG